MGVPLTNTLYDSDILAWSEQQADVLRALQRARPDLPNDLDLENIIEEIETVGRNEVRAAESCVRLILVHVVKAVSDPDAPSLGHWRAEVLSWHNDLLGAFAPSMRVRIDMDTLWARAVREVAGALEEHGSVLAEGLPEASPFSIDDLVAATFDLRAAVKTLAMQRPSR